MPTINHVYASVPEGDKRVAIICSVRQGILDAGGVPRKRLSMCGDIQLLERGSINPDNLAIAPAQAKFAFIRSFSHWLK